MAADDRDGQAPEEVREPRARQAGPGEGPPPGQGGPGGGPPPGQGGPGGGPPLGKVDVAAATGRLAGKMATGLGGALLRNRTVRKTIRRAQEEARGEGPPTAP